MSKENLFVGTLLLIGFIWAAVFISSIWDICKAIHQHQQQDATEKQQ
jgi:hypothetical protein